MSGIAGIIYRNADGLDASRWQRMVDALAYWGPDGCHTHHDDHAAFAYFHLAATPEAAYERQPRILANGEWLVAAARLDNRTELCDVLQIAPERRPTLADGDLIEQAYLKWGQDCVQQLYGDWSFAVWHPTAQRLFLARDQLGQTALYYHANHKYIAFASGRKALLALDPELRAIDDLYMAQVLLSWPVYHGQHTVHRHIKRLPPAHTLTATPHQLCRTCYWHVGDIQTLPLRSREEAAEGLLYHFEQAVASRLRANGPIGVTLSGGLDSGAVTALAAALTPMKQSLTAYTSRLIGESHVNNERRFGNEWELAAASATFAQVNRHHPIQADDITPLEGIAQMLWVHDEPQHAAGNAYWLVSLLRRAKAEGNRVLLTGQGGNATISWTGSPPTYPKYNGLDLYSRVRDALFHVAPTSLVTRLRIWQMARKADWRVYSAINPNLVQRAHVIEDSVNDPLHPIHEYNVAGLPVRLALIMPSRTIIGGLWHENSAAFGIEARDPTLDLRLVQYSLAIPDHLFYDADTSLDRLLIRQAMAGRLPDAVRLNRKRGLQSADIVHRLRQDAPAMEVTLDELAKGQAADYLNLPNLRQAWTYIQQHDDVKAYRDALVILLRGMMAGLFIHQHE